MSRAQNLLDIWELYSKQVILEKAPGKKAEKMTKKPGPGPVDINSPKAGKIGQQETTGPNATDNFNGPAFNRKISDLKTMTDKEKKERPYVAQLNVSVENFDTNMEKNTKTIINNNMKSTFDKLFEEVMNSENDMDLQALGVDAETDDLGGEGEMGGEITVTLSPEHVDALRAILAQIDGGDMEGEVELGDETTPDDDMGSEEDAEEKHKKKEKEEDAEEDYEEDGEMNREATEMHEVPDSAGLGLINKAKMKVGDATSKHDAGAGHAGTTTVSDDVDGKGKNVADTTGLAMTKHSNNKPKSKIKGGNQMAFGIK
jgi:hypothetical protein